MEKNAQRQTPHDARRSGFGFPVRGVLRVNTNALTRSMAFSNSRPPRYPGSILLHPESPGPEKAGACLQGIGVYSFFVFSHFFPV
jgi:hypothetical protein